MQEICVLGLYLVPAGALAAQPWRRGVFFMMAAYFMTLLSPTNEMSYDPVQFYNAALGIFAGYGAEGLSFRLLPPVSPAFRTRCLLTLTLRDLRRLTTGHMPRDWAGHIHGRLAAMPAEATPLQRAQLLAALSVGTEIIRLRPVASRLGQGADLESALAAVAQGHSTIAAARFIRLDAAFARRSENELDASRGRASILVLSEALAEHAAYFDSRALP